MGLCLLFLTGLLAGPAWTQGLFGTISGTVTDPGGGVIPNATVTVTNINTNVKVTVQTNGSGDYSVPSLIPGTYQVEAAAQGFKTALQTNVVLRVDANPRVSLKLEIGSASETVTVTGEGA